MPRGARPGAAKNIVASMRDVTEAQGWTLRRRGEGEGKGEAEGRGREESGGRGRLTEGVGCPGQ